MENKTILVIDDDYDMCELLSFHLRYAGFNVLTAKEGEKGLREARQKKPDLIILDLKLPDLPGAEICKAIREDKDPNFSKVPIVMLTAKTADVERYVGKAVGANEFMTKPVDVKKLVSEVNKWIQEKDRKQSSPAI